MADTGRGDGAEDSLRRAQELLARGDYDGALAESRIAAALSPNGALADEALFHLGLIHLQLGRSKRDYREAREYFRRVAARPSRWAGQATIMIGMLEEHEALLAAVQSLKEENEKIGQALKKLKEEQEKLQQVINRLKQVDIEIEEKKREKR